MTELSVVVPAYNEEKRIIPNLRNLQKTLDEIGTSYEVVVVNDGSTDKTYDVVKKFFRNKKNFRVFNYKENHGKGAAIKAGFFKTKGDLITFIDADGDLPPEQIQTFLGYLDIQKADVVIGSKRHPDSIVNYPLKRRILSRGYQLMNRILFNLPVKDTQSGLKLFRREVLEEVFPKVLIKRFAFDLEILANAHRKGYKIVEAPIRLNHNSKFNGLGIHSLFPIFVDTLAVAYRMHIKKHYD